MVDRVRHDGKIGREAPLQGQMQMRGQVCKINRLQIGVEFAGEIFDIEKGTWRYDYPMNITSHNNAFSRLDVGLNDWSLKQQLKAIEALNQNPYEMDQTDYPSSDTTKEIHARDDDSAGGRPFSRHVHEAKQTILNGTTLRDKLLRAFQGDFIPYDSHPSSADELQDQAVIPPPVLLKPSDVDATAVPPLRIQSEMSGILSQNQLIYSWTRRHRAAHLPMNGDPEMELNPSQTRAIAMMLSERLSLVQGVSPACKVCDRC